MAAVKPFKVSVSDYDIDRLNTKLQTAVLPDELDEAAWDYGAPLKDVKRIAKYWHEKFDWRRAEDKINQLPNYETKIDVEGFETVDVHFVHWKSGFKDAVPLIFVHGWPGSFIEVTKILPILGDSHNNGGPAFDVVAPSLPNFGFSGSTRKRGFGIEQYAETCHKLMLKLGYEQYVSQGGDWGSIISRVMTNLYPTAVRAAHVNMVIAAPPMSIWTPFATAGFLIGHALNWYTEKEAQGLKRVRKVQEEGMGYFKEQSTKPQTVGYALADSPVALLAWIYEKLHDWTDDYPWTDEEICVWISIYWFSRAGPAASVRIYYEYTKGTWGKRFNFGKGVKLGLAYFPGEMATLPRAWGRRLGDVVFESEHEEGGHFAAWEKPELLAGDLRKMFSKGGPAFGVVDGKTGYA